MQQGGQMVVFHGTPYQRGYGLGSFFQSLARKALPFIKQGAKTLGRAALDTGVNIAQDVLAGNNLKTAARSRVRQTAKTLREQAFNRLASQTGSGRKQLKRKAPQKKIISSQSIKVKRAKAAPRKRKKNKRKLPLTHRQVKKSKVTHLKDIFD